MSKNKIWSEKAISIYCAWGCQVSQLEQVSYLIPPQFNSAPVSHLNTEWEFGNWFKTSQDCSVEDLLLVCLGFTPIWSNILGPWKTLLLSLKTLSHIFSHERFRIFRTLMIYSFLTQTFHAQIYTVFFAILFKAESRYLIVQYFCFFDVV